MEGRLLLLSSLSLFLSLLSTFSSTQNPGTSLDNPCFVLSYSLLVFFTWYLSRLSLFLFYCQYWYSMVVSCLNCNTCFTILSSFALWLVVVLSVHASWLWHLFLFIIFLVELRNSLFLFSFLCKFRISLRKWTHLLSFSMCLCSC